MHFKKDTSFLDCKHKHMMTSGAPPDKVGVLYRLLPIEFHCSQAELIVIILWFLVLSQFLYRLYGVPVDENPLDNVSDPLGIK